MQKQNSMLMSSPIYRFLFLCSPALPGVREGKVSAWVRSPVAPMVTGSHDVPGVGADITGCLGKWSNRM